MLIQVKQKHIKNGCKSESESCPIALAMLEQKVAANINVLSDHIRIYHNSGYLANYDRYTLPRSARRFIARFDSGKKVKPFNFIFRKEA